MVERFELAAAIAETSEHLADLELCEARLQLDGRYPWIVLIPRRAGLTELEQLTVAERAVLMEEVIRAGEAVRAIGASSSSPSSGSQPASSQTTTSSTNSSPTTSSTTLTSPHVSPWKPVEKLNVGCLGNVTSQLHVHVVGRRRDDPSWPSPVWGSGQPETVTPEAASIARRAALPWLESRPR
jgi:diadenosine tetraphosphate (Ap4A) HIT family hydrolase